jgi:pimeloyl-ACP methyl ester carboxylesterase
MPAIERGGTKIAWREAGRGETVVLLHSSASSSAQWRSLMEILGTSYHVVAPDLHGYGDSGPWSGAGPFALADEVALVESVLPGGAGPLHLIGHSYGGAVALHFALRYPTRLRSLTLIEPVAFHLLCGQAPLEESRRLLREVRSVASLISEATANGDYRGAMAQFVDYWNGTGAWKRLDPLLQSDLARRIPKIALDFRATLMEPSAPAAYRNVFVPALILRGSGSPAPARRLAEVIAETLPQSRLQTIEGAGHMLPLTHADAINRAIVEHLSGCVAGRRPAAA